MIGTLLGDAVGIYQKISTTQAELAGAKAAANAQQINAQAQADAARASLIGEQQKAKTQEQFGYALMIMGGIASAISIGNFVWSMNKKGKK